MSPQSTPGCCRHPGECTPPSCKRQWRDRLRFRQQFKSKHTAAAAAFAPAALAGPFTLSAAAKTLPALAGS
ncbi:MAG TPA: hypothetical protein VKN73_06040, partial [Desulfosalsimonadaceae bacterium]|nr:hypothetical protein [Desulfosalsimonadaceae bacterium]